MNIGILKEGTCFLCDCTTQDNQVYAIKYSKSTDINDLTTRIVHVCFKCTADMYKATLFAHNYTTERNKKEIVPTSNLIRVDFANKRVIK